MRYRLTVVLLAAAALALALPARAQAQVGTLTGVTETALELGTGMYSLTATWTSDASGAVSGHAFALAGRIVQVRIVPSSGGTQPTALFDAQIVDADGLSLLTRDGVDYGANLSNSTPTQLQMDPPVVVDGRRTLDIIISNAGNAKSGTVVFWVQR